MPELSPGGQQALGVGGMDINTMFNQGMDQYASADATAKQALATKGAAMAPVQAKIAAAGQGPTPPEYPQIPEKMEHKGLSPQEMTQSVQTMFALAAIGGAMTRQPMTAAMNNFSAALKGLHEGDEALFKREGQEFDRNVRAATSKANLVHQKYKDAMEKHKGDIQGYMNEARLIATEYNDTMSLAMFEKGMAKEQMNLAFGMQKSADSAEKTRMMMEHYYKMDSARQQDANTREGAAAAKAAKVTGGTNTRNMLVQGAGKNAINRLGEMRGESGDFPNTSVMFGQHGDGVVSRAMHGVGQAALSTEQQKIDAGYASLIDEAIPVFTGGLRGSDAFRKFLLGQVPQPGDAQETANEKMRLFEANINGTLNTFGAAFKANPAFKADGETGEPAESGGPLTQEEQDELNSLRAKHGRK